MKNTAGTNCIPYGQNRLMEGLFIRVVHSTGVLLRKVAITPQLLAVAREGGGLYRVP